MRKLLSLALGIVGLGFTSLAFADTCSSKLTTFFTSYQATKLCTSFGSAINSSLIPNTDNTYDLGTALKQWRTLYIGTGVVFAAGANDQLTPYAPVLAATPVAATNIFQPGLNVVPTFAANTAAFLGAATPIPGQQFKISNASSNSIRVKAAGGATLNGATAGGYIAVPNLATVECFTQSATNQVCEQPVIPTPAGP